MKFRGLAVYLERLEKNSSRLKITEILAEIFSKAGENEIDKTVYLLLGKLAPAYRGIVFNLAETMVLRVIAKAYGKKVAEIKSLYKKRGDLGDVAAQLASARQALPMGKDLSVSEVYKRLVKIAQDEGEGSQERKVKVMADLLSNLDPLSVRYVARIPVGKLRLGFSDKTIIDALSWMLSGGKSQSKVIGEAYQVQPDVGLLAKRIKKVGIKKATGNPAPIVGIPVMPMLAQRLKSTGEMIEKMGEVAVEPKFDGVRVLIHYKKRGGGEKPFIRAFTRNLNDVSGMFPELLKIGRFIDAKSVILDSEAVGIDPKTERIVDFQKTMQRRRKHNIRQTAKDIPMRFQVFDILTKNGKSFMNTPYKKRREVLAKTIKKNSFLVVDEYQITDNAQVIKKDHERLLKEGLEGVIVKKLDSHYVPGRTGWRWVKMKEVESDVAKLSDTIDAVVMGYTRGKGKRAGFGVGQFLVGVGDGDQIKTISKVGTGLTDDQFRELNKRLKEITVERKPKEYLVDKVLEPDYWVIPSLVVEIAADEITKSPRHTSGYALRFPRLVRFRDDKSESQITTLSEVNKFYRMQ